MQSKGRRLQLMIFGILLVFVYAPAGNSSETEPNGESPYRVVWQHDSKG